MILFAANALLWWGWSAAATYGWAINNDYNIVRNLGGFMLAWGLPLFNALIMGDPVIKDFDQRLDPLDIFQARKPRIVSARKILRQLLRARLLHVGVHADVTGVAMVPVNTTRGLTS